MLALPPVAPVIGWRTLVRLPRDHYVRLDGNDYSVDPAVVGRRVEVVADLGTRDRRPVRRDGGRLPPAVLGQAPVASPTRSTTGAPRRSPTAPPTGPDRRQPPIRMRSSSGPGRVRHRVRPAGRGGRLMAATKTAAAGRDVTAELAFLTRALKAPTLREAVDRLAERARAESWTHEEFLVACLQREVSARESHGGEGRIRAARFPARKSLEDFDFDHARGLKRDLIAHLGTLDFVTARDNVVFLGPPGTGKTHLATGLAIRACQAGHRVLFATAVRVGRPTRRRPPRRPPARRAESASAATRCWSSTRSATSPSSPRPRTCSSSWSSSRYERASLIVTSNKPFGRWGEVFGDDVVAAAMIDRLVHHADVIALKGDSYRLKDRDLGRVPTTNATED